MSLLMRVKPRWSRLGVTKSVVPMAGLVEPKAMVFVGPPLLARAVNRGSVAIGVAPPKLVAVRIKLFAPLVAVMPLLIVKATKSVGVVVLWPMMVVLMVAVAVAPSPKT